MRDHCAKRVGVALQATVENMRLCIRNKIFRLRAVSLFFFTKLLQEKHKHASRDKRGRKPEKKK